MWSLRKWNDVYVVITERTEKAMELMTIVYDESDRKFYIQCSASNCVETEEIPRSKTGKGLALDNMLVHWNEEHSDGVA